MNYFKKLKYYSPYFLRKRFREKYIIIESDDWGLERALTFDTIQWMKKKYGEENFSRWTLDSLETSEDLNLLFDLLEKYKNNFENPPVITANFITHNIDYSNPDRLKFIPLSKGFNPETEDVRNLYMDGIKKGYIFPQLHGYSHYNNSYLAEYFNSPEGREAFNEKFFVAKSTIKSKIKTYIIEPHGEMSNKNLNMGLIGDANNEFKNFFGFKSKTFIPATFIFDLEYLKVVTEAGIRLLQGTNRFITSECIKYDFPYFRKRHGLFMSVRNSRLDPHKDYNLNHEQCLDSIGKAMDNKIPAVIDFHRVNFAGKFDKKSRDTTLKELKLLFDKIFIKWPGVKFIHAQMLYEILNQAGVL